MWFSIQRVNIGEIKVRPNIGKLVLIIPNQANSLGNGLDRPEIV